jgi:hypothetical protein
LVPAVDVEKHGATPPQSDVLLHVKSVQPDAPESPLLLAQVPPFVEFPDESHENVEPLMQPD